MEEQAALTRLSVFPGSFTLSAAEAVTGVGLDLIDELVEASLVKPIDEGTRLLLLETIREFAAERLDSADSEALQTTHARYYLDLITDTARAFFETDETRMFPMMTSEFHNLREALYRADNEGDSDRILAACHALARFWNYHGCSDPTLSEVIRRAIADGDPGLQQFALVALAILYRLQGNDKGLKEADARRLALAREGGNGREIAAALNNVAMAAWERGDVEEAKGLFAEAFTFPEWPAQPNLGMLHLSVGELDEAEAVMRHAIAVAEEDGDPGAIAISRLDSRGFVICKELKRKHPSSSRNH